MGRIHSIESLGALDGPGLRTVVFLQGCPFRCAYCHNPDSRNPSGGTEMSAGELVKKIIRYKPYFGENGGLTLSGGEPLLQGDFCAEIIKLCRKEGISTAIDTSGGILHKEAVGLADLIILDIKHTRPQKLEELTGINMDNLLEFTDYCAEIGKPVWIRQVILPEINDRAEDMRALKDMIKGLNVKKTELLPYHNLGINKWRELGLEYSLKDMESPAAEKIEQLYNFLMEQI